MDKEYDVHGKVVGSTRVRLAGLLSAALTDLLGQPITVRARDIFPSTNRWASENWYTTFWLVTPWGGTRKTVYGMKPMRECVAGGVTVTPRNPQPPNDATTFYEVRPNA